MQDLRLACGSYGFDAPKKFGKKAQQKKSGNVWNPIWRGINGVQKKIIQRN